MATDIPRIHKWWQQPSRNNDYRNTQTQAHGWLDGRTNAWNDNNTHRHQCWPRVSHLETSAFLTLCHSFPVTCQQMCKNLKMWLTDLLTDKRTDRPTDKIVAGGHYCWGVLLWPPQLGLGGKCDKKWKFNKSFQWGSNIRPRPSSFEIGQFGSFCDFIYVGVKAEVCATGEVWVNR